ncbi:hypothetical protein CSKR_200013 [Clonorchis sinensis]|uniref:Uncharacterized protein n=1 Tax=Clonorchis sinensis TaxID=79923 RepID=A0A8T1LXH3_CLOSI|nr:hypothetical protein CSKR_200013 [Clonorchis sinensis]
MLVGTACYTSTRSTHCSARFSALHHAYQQSTPGALHAESRVHSQTTNSHTMQTALTTAEPGPTSSLSRVEFWLFTSSPANCHRSSESKSTKSTTPLPRPCITRDTEKAPARWDAERTVVYLRTQDSNGCERLLQNM